MHWNIVAALLEPVCCDMGEPNSVFAPPVTPLYEAPAPRVVLVFICVAEALQGGRDWKWV